MTKRQLESRLKKIEKRMQSEWKKRRALHLKMDASRKRIDYWAKARGAVYDRLGLVRQGQQEFNV